MNKKNSLEQGFMTIELIVTIIIAATFLLAFYTLFNTTIISNAQAQQFSSANIFAQDTLSVLKDNTVTKANFASACLRDANGNFVNLATVKAVDFTRSDSTKLGKVVYDSTYAPGKTITDNLTGNTTTYNDDRFLYNLPYNIRVKGTIYAPQGCKSQSPILLRTNVIFGRDNTTAEAATYVQQ